MGFSRYLASRMRSGRGFARLAAWLAVTSVALAVAVPEVAVSIATGFEREIQAKIIGFTGDAHFGSYLPQADDSIRRLTIPRELTWRVKNHPDVARYTGYVRRQAVLKSRETMEGVEIKGVDADWNADFFASALVAGRLPVFPDSGYGNEALISRKTGLLLNAPPGEEIRAYFWEKGRVRMRKLVVAGWYETGLTEIDEQLAIADIRLLRRILGWEEEEVQGAEIFFKPGRGVADYLARERRFVRANTNPFDVIAEWDALLGADLKAIPVSVAYADLFEWLGLQHQNVRFIVVLMTIVALINLAGVVVIMITERAATVGILKALGASHRQIQGIFLWNAAYLIFVGLALGNAIGLIVLYIQDRTGFITLDPDSYFVKTAPVAWIPFQFLTINLMAIASFIPALTVPLIYVLRIKPTRAIQMG
jgi:lipoprotein-releasing system permease protein